MIKIAVVIITYRRPQGLQRVLDGLESQRYAEGVHQPHLMAIVVDNDQKSSAAPTVQEFVTKNKLEVKYIHEPAQGIPIARNAGLTAVPEDYDFMCFIDDDEWPGETWIEQLLKTQQLNNADCVLGAVIPIYPESAPKWIVKSRVFDSWRFKDNARLKEAASNNVLIANGFIKKHHHQFDERMRMTGGSDYLFFKQANQLGMRIFWSDNAPVYEEVPMSRLTLRWITQRHYRQGNTFSVSEHLAGTKLGLVTLAVKGTLRIGLGIAMLPSFIFSYQFGMKGIKHLLRGAGILAGVFGHLHQEYSTENLVKDRPTNTI
jgi:glycosyltransferase involved in cell wall biosynthesis